MGSLGKEKKPITDLLRSLPRVELLHSGIQQKSPLPTTVSSLGREVKVSG